VVGQPSTPGAFPVPAAPRPTRSRSIATGLDPKVKTGLRSRSRSAARELHGSTIPEVRLPQSSSSQTARTSRQALPPKKTEVPSFSDVAAAALFGGRGQAASTTSQANRRGAPRGRHVPVSTTSTSAKTTSTSTSTSTSTTTTATRPQTRSQGPAQESGLPNPRKVRGGKS
jgi:hypothetical protein